jgi:hypothetical protein
VHNLVDLLSIAIFYKCDYITLIIQT